MPGSRVFPYHKLRIDYIERIIRVNLTSAMILTRLVLPGVLAPRTGHIVNMSSLSGKAGPPCSEPYVATKAGLIAFTESLGQNMPAPVLVFQSLFRDS